MAIPEAGLRCYRHPDRETYVTCTRCGRPICPACMRTASVGFHCPDDVAAAHRSQRVARTPVGAPAEAGPPVVTWLLIAVNVLVFVATVPGGTSLGLSGGSSPLLRDFGLIPSYVAAGQDYRLLTSMFLHFGLLHIGFNMYALYLMGPSLERVLGRWRYLALYLAAGLVGSVASYDLGPVLQNAAGASGAIFGLFGAYVVVARRVGAPLRGIVTVIGINLVLTVTIPHIDLWGHVGGLVGGAAIAAGYAYAPPGRLRLPVQMGVVALAALVVVVGTVVRTRALTQMGLA